ncbi:MAG: hypothetical protein Ct9H300mP1_01940 [Planctomycetaceae bacterium]|nr:MAG: hypothetical protein Ct9H300mP1_01940 [Planctomycetaceae bacterium]
MASKAIELSSAIASLSNAPTLRIAPSTVSSNGMTASASAGRCSGDLCSRCATVETTSMGTRSVGCVPGAGSEVAIS